MKPHSHTLLAIFLLAFDAKPQSKLLSVVEHASTRRLDVYEKRSGHSRDLYNFRDEINGTETTLGFHGKVNFVQRP